MKLDRLGVQIGLWQYAWVKAVPRATMASKCGVLTCSLPKAPMVSKRCWSVQYQRILGRLLMDALEHLSNRSGDAQSYIRFDELTLSHRRYRYNRRERTQTS